uniref:Uncharacterized protein n=1 Tax=Ralstonia solanacearum TaxID=305 RepID=A0A0S4TZA7_RALSL|nr:protein of unknown function [Ralstonia solanacearum]
MARSGFDSGTYRMLGEINRGLGEQKSGSRARLVGGSCLLQSHHGCACIVFAGPWAYCSINRHNRRPMGRR